LCASHKIKMLQRKIQRASGSTRAIMEIVLQKVNDISLEQSILLLGKVSA
jgi:hypothetical protein